MTDKTKAFGAGIWTGGGMLYAITQLFNPPNAYLGIMIIGLAIWAIGVTEKEINKYD